MGKLNVFVIMPFDDELNSFYRHLKDEFSEVANLRRADDFLNQQNILKDIVQPIFNADLVIADLTGLNANVFYELGLAHAFRKNVVLITQDIAELPFDLRSYRVIEYSMHFARIKAFEENVSKIFKEYSSISFGSPVTDWVSVEEHVKSLIVANSETAKVAVVSSLEKTSDSESEIDEVEVKGFLDFIADLEESMLTLTSIIDNFGNETSEVGELIQKKSEDAEKMRHRGSASSLRKIARSIASSMQEYGRFLTEHNKEYESQWNIIDHSLTHLIESPFSVTEENKSDLLAFLETLNDVNTILMDAKGQIRMMADGVSGLVGIEASITRSASLIFRETKSFEGLIDKSISSLERIINVGRDRVGTSINVG